MLDWLLLLPGSVDTKSLAGDPEFENQIRAQTEAFARSTPYHSLDLGGGRIIPGLIPIEQLRSRLNAYPIPRDLRGKRVLDVGAASGWNSFELERRGAEVVAVDCVEYEEFLIARSLIGSKVDYRILDVEEMTPAMLGTFDYVLFFGVLYHLRHPLLALEKVCALTRETAFIESYVADDKLAPDNCSLEFYETDELGGQIDNWCGPSTQCLVSLCRAAGFARAEFLYNSNRRAGVVCHRHWAESGGSGDGPLLCFAVNNRHDDMYFSPAKDEYICVHLQYAGELTGGDVFVEVDGYGVPLIVLAGTGADAWQINVRVPPGLEPGAHDLTVRVHRSAPSNSARLIMLHAGEERPTHRPELATAPAYTIPAPELIAVQSSLDNTTAFRGYRKEKLCCYFTVQQPPSYETVEIQIDGVPAPLCSLGLARRGLWQVNLNPGRTLAPGEHQVRVRTAGSPLSNPLSFQFVPTASGV